MRNQLTRDAERGEQYQVDVEKRHISEICTHLQWEFHKPRSYKLIWNSTTKTKTFKLNKKYPNWQIILHGEFPGILFIYESNSISTY